MAAERVGAALGRQEFYFKRDDLLGRALGGSKLRKLELICADARRIGADCLVTEGALESNHASLTSVVGSVLELPVSLVLSGEKGAVQSPVHAGLQARCGAEVHLVEYDASHRESALAARVTVKETTAALLDDLRRRGHRPYWIPEGGCCPLGSYSFAMAFAEVHEQMRMRGHERYEIYVAVGTGSTYAGLLCGAWRCGARVRIRGVSVAYPRKRAIMQARKAISELCASQGWDSRGIEEIEICDNYLGSGYGAPTAAANEAIDSVLCMEGLLLDLTYTGKAMAGALDLLARDASSLPVVFWHTGGIPGAVGRLFGFDRETALNRGAS
jgi:1-aminocyclopropane-1-carboxylate deaminase/D-cysteine desulfhydrase-like pyridoxal-dependent ACC family enzyme